jgi:hypothetical protein
MMYYEKIFGSPLQIVYYNRQMVLSDEMINPLLPMWSLVVTFAY